MLSLPAIILETHEQEFVDVAANNGGVVFNILDRHSTARLVGARYIEVADGYAHLLPAGRAAAKVWQPRKQYPVQRGGWRLPFPASVHQYDAHHRVWGW